MNRYVAFLRAVNVGGRSVLMEDLRSLLDDLGYGNVQTFLASGNVIFDTAEQTPSVLEEKLEEELEYAYGFRIDCFVRSISQVSDIASTQPFDEELHEDTAAFNVALLKTVPAEAEEVLAGLETEVDSLKLVDTEVYWLCLLKQSESKLNQRVFERRLGTLASIRTIRTFLRLAKKFN